MAYGLYRSNTRQIIWAKRFEWTNCVSMDFNSPLNGWLTYENRHTTRAIHLVWPEYWTVCSNPVSNAHFFSPLGQICTTSNSLATKYCSHAFLLKIRDLSVKMFHQKIPAYWNIYVQSCAGNDNDGSVPWNSGQIVSSCRYPVRALVRLRSLFTFPFPNSIVWPFFLFTQLKCA